MQCCAMPPHKTQTLLSTKVVWAILLVYLAILTLVIIALGSKTNYHKVATELARFSQSLRIYLICDKALNKRSFLSGRMVSPFQGM